MSSTGTATLQAWAVPSVAGYARPQGDVAVQAFAIPDATGWAAPTGPVALAAYAVPAIIGAPLATATVALSVSAVPAITAHPVASIGAAIEAQAVPAITDAAVVALQAFAVPAASTWVGEAAAGIWLHVHTVPPAQIYADDAVRGRLRPWLPMYRAGFDLDATQAQAGQVNDAFRVSINGASAALRQRLAQQAPMGVRFDVMDGGTLSRTGTTAGFSIGNDGALDIDVEATGWTTLLPLRTNADLGIFRDLVALPLRYGRNVPGACVRLGAEGKRWLWADHASARIRSVQIDGQDYGAWQWRNETDDDGNAITIIETADAIDDGAQLVAVGDGMLDADSGALVVNPADMAADLCSRAGVAIDRGALSPFRAECQARNIEISGTVDGGTLQAALVTIADSVYAAFSRELPDLMRLQPRTGATVTIPPKDTPTAAAQREGIATRLRVRYALEDGTPRASLEVRASAVEAVRGVSTADVNLPLVRDSRVALDIAGRMLQDRARVAYTINASPQRRRLVPGQVVNASVAKLGLSGEAMITQSRIAERDSTPTLLLRIGTAPTITVAATATAYAPQQYTGATVSTAGNDARITITGPDGRPIVGAQCTLDGNITRNTDGAGVVAFPLSVMTPGPHTIAVIAAGFAPFTLEVFA